MKKLLLALLVPAFALGLSAQDAPKKDKAACCTKDKACTDKKACADKKDKACCTKDKAACKDACKDKKPADKAKK